MANDLEMIINNTKPNDAISNMEALDHTKLFVEIIKAGRYDLLSNNVFNLDIKDDDVSLELLNMMLKNEDIAYYIKLEGFQFDKTTLDKIRELYLKHYKVYDYEIDNFVYSFFTKEEFNEFIEEHKDLFLECAMEHDVYKLKSYPAYVDILLSVGKVDNLREIDKYTVSNFKMLAMLLKDNVEISSNYGSDRVLIRLFEIKDELTKEEFCNLLKMFTDKVVYRIVPRGENIDIFSKLVNENIDFLVDCVVAVGTVPRCLRESGRFRQACIDSNRMYLAVQCVVPEELDKDNELLLKYANELKVSSSKLQERVKFVRNYHKKNSDIYDSMIADMLRDEYCSVSDKHYERFINDINVQSIITAYNAKELKVFNRLLEIVDYQNYDAAFMMYNVMINITKYNNLINSINLDELDINGLKMLLVVLQDSSNYYGINSVEELYKFNEIKKDKFEKFDTDKLDVMKESLVRYLFNLDLDEARRINVTYCYDYDGNSLIEVLANSELPKPIFKMLCVLNSIMDCKDLDTLKSLDLANKHRGIYESYLPLDVYLRKEYTKLYDNSIYKCNKETDKSKFKYNDSEVEMYVPRGEIGFLIHCVGTCSLAEDSIDSNYCVDWMERPQMQDHFVACSYINQYNLNSRTGGDVVYGFANLEGGAIYGMGATDIDSIGTYARSYNCAYPLMKGNGNRAHVLPPSVMVNLTQSYNELVIERRNNKGSINGDFKRKPDCIILSVDSVDNMSNFRTLSELMNVKLGFLSEEEMEVIKSTKNPSDIKGIISSHIREIYENLPDPEINQNVVINMYVDTILKTLHYEHSLKAAREFDIPIVVVDKLYYFKKVLSENEQYSEEEKKTLLDMYLKGNDSIKKRIWDYIRFDKEYDAIVNSINGNRNKSGSGINVVL